MKKFCAVIFLIFAVYISSAKDIGIKIINETPKGVTVYAGIISLKNNYLEDNELVQSRETYGIVTVGRKINSGKNISITQRDVPKRKILILFGILDGGGRTEVFRFNTSETEEKITLTFEKPAVLIPSSSYLNVAKKFAETHDIGTYQSMGNVRIGGYFLMYNVATENKAEVYLFNPSIVTDMVVSDSSNSEVSDVILKTATFPFMDSKGNIVAKAPENSTEPYREVVFPPYTKMTEIFGDKPFMYLTWRTVYTRMITAKPAAKNNIELFNSCKDFEKKQMMDIFGRNFFINLSPDIHLYYIKSVSRTDSIILYNNHFEPLTEADQLSDNDIVTSGANYRPSGDRNVIYTGTNIVRNVSAVDLTPLLVYKIASQGTFKNTLNDAGDLLELYKYLGTYIQTPDLDEEALNMNKPAYTIAKIRENVNKPDFYATLETKLNTEIAGPIPTAILESLVRKLEKK